MIRHPPTSPLFPYTPLSRPPAGASQDRHLCHGDQKENCRRPIDSLFRTEISRRDYWPQKTLPGPSERSAEKLAKSCAELASNKKAEEIVVLDLRLISTFTDFFVICSATSEPQLKAIANEIETRLKEDHGIRPSTIDGFPGSQWIVLDYLQVVVHVFHRDKRSFYSLEDLWGDRKSTRLNSSHSQISYAVFCLKK